MQSRLSSVGEAIFFHVTTNQEEGLYKEHVHAKIGSEDVLGTKKRKRRCLASSFLCLKDWLFVNTRRIRGRIVFFLGLSSKGIKQYKGERERERKQGIK